MKFFTLVGLVGLLIVSISVNGKASELHPGQELEAHYAEALLALNSGDYVQSLKILESILKINPNHISALELKALVLRSTGKDPKALEIYQKLIHLQKKEGERAPYHFEIGIIHFRAKRFEEAKSHLLKAVSGNFNAGPSFYFLGMMAFQKGDFIEADEFFSQVPLRKSSDELLVASRYFSGLALSRTGFGSSGARELQAAAEGARKFQRNSSISSTEKNAAQALQAMDRSHWFGNISLLMQYDGNVSLVSTNASSQDVSGKKSFKANLVGGLGYLSSPMHPFQWAASYRLAYNRNLNSQAREYEFLSNVPAIYLTYLPIDRTNYGLKIEGNGTFQNRTDPAKGNTLLRPYSLSADVGPFVRHELYRKTILTFEIIDRPQKYYTDPVSGQDRRSGNALDTSVSLKYDSPKPAFNLLASLSFEINNSKGENFKSRTLTLDLANTFRLPDAHGLSLSTRLSATNYPQNNLARQDRNISLRLSWVKEFAQRWSVLADGSYTRNLSNASDLYSYVKPVVSLGLSYLL